MHSKRGSRPKLTDNHFNDLYDEFEEAQKDLEIFKKNSEDF